LRIAVRLQQQQKVEQFNILINSLKKDENNIFLLTLLIAKISIKKYWENKRDFFLLFYDI